MKLHQLRALAEVDKAGSIQRAAQAMNLSQPALSKAIRELERQLGAVLVHRSVSGATLTPAGAILSKRYHGIQKELDKAREELDWFKGMRGGRLMIGMSPPVAGIGVAGILSRFRQHRPSHRVELLELRPAQIFDTVRDGLLDFGILHHHGTADLAGLHCVPLAGFDTLLAVGSCAPAPATLDELWSCEWLTADLADYPSGYLAAFASSLGRELPERIVRCTSMAVCFELADEPRLVSHWAADISPYLDLKFATGALVPVSLDLPLPRMAIVLVYKDEALLSPGAAALARMLRAAFETHHPNS